MTYKIAICDDMEQDTLYIAAAVKEWAKQENVCVDIHMFPSAESFLFDYAEQKNYDFLLLDIEMPSMNGVELGRRTTQCKLSLSRDIRIVWLKAMKFQRYTI